MPRIRGVIIISIYFVLCTNCSQPLCSGRKDEIRIARMFTGQSSWKQCETRILWRKNERVVSDRLHLYQLPQETFWSKFHLQLPNRYDCVRCCTTTQLGFIIFTPCKYSFIIRQYKWMSIAWCHLSDHCTIQRTVHNNWYGFSYRSTFHRPIAH